MNIFLKELKSNIKPFIFWSIGIFILVAASMVKFEGLSSNTQASEELLKSFPKIVLTLFGMNNLNIMQLDGYYGIIFFFVVIMAAIYSSNIGVKCSAYEINEKTSEFIFSKPVSREYIIIMKICASILMIILFCLVSYICSLIGLVMLNTENTIMNEIILLNVSLFFTSIVYFAFGLLLGSINPKKGSINSSILFLATYLIAIIYDMIENNGIIQFFTPIKYFDISKVILENKLNIVMIVFSLAISLLFLTIGIKKINKKDL
jgi:ABC-2 type transport system permease protein